MDVGLVGLDREVAGRELHSGGRAAADQAGYRQVLSVDVWWIVFSSVDGII